MEQRILRLTNLNDVSTELKSLESGPVETTATWSFYQILSHCSDDLESSIKGNRKPFPWVIRVTLGNLLKRKFLKDGFYTRPAMAGGKGRRIEGDEKAALVRLRKAVADFMALPNQPISHIFFGKITKEECEKLTVYHIAHHLGFACLKKST